jgi:cell fate regulator YaaT (PSP1 superfamily)
MASKEIEPAEGSEPLKPVVRKADENDIARAYELESKGREALTEGTALVERLNLPMKLVSADYNLDGSRVTVFFTAAERVDFRELVREMAARLRTRVELRQVGPRDEAKLVGGYGRCGRQLCCGAFLSELAPVSIRMAKDQGLPLNPLKISGCCGRLMCCLSYECQQYREMRQGLPREGQRVTTASGGGKVVGVSPLVGSVSVRLDESEAIVEFPAAEVKVEPRQSGIDKSEIRIPKSETDSNNRNPNDQNV